jgi:hypothetical protein
LAEKSDSNFVLSLSPIESHDCQEKMQQNTVSVWGIARKRLDMVFLFLDKRQI